MNNFDGHTEPMYFMRTLVTSITELITDYSLYSFLHKSLEVLVYFSQIRPCTVTSLRSYVSYTRTNPCQRKGNPIQTLVDFSTV